MTGTAKKWISWLVKAIVLILAFVFIYRRLNHNNELKHFQELITQVNRAKAIIIVSLVVLLMLVNWLLEAMKWRYLTAKWSPITLWQSIESVFCGLTWAIFTPNRLGEYGGRVMFLPPRRRLHGVFAMAVGSFGQNVVTSVMGASSLLWFVYYFLNVNKWLFVGLLSTGIGYMLMMLIFYFNVRWLVFLLNSVPFLKKYHRFFDVMKRYHFAELFRIMGYCVARFAVFSLQYYLIIHLLLPEIPMVKMMLLVFVFFFIQSALPTIDVVDIGIRSATADKLFEYVTHQHIVVIAAVALIWFTNLIVPAILGSVFVLKVKFFDNNI
ncbi:MULTISPECIES: lysylphosphatidylglycerol synthase domain-containing protein [unclassified Mucilaginibacter]|uniref:lysylphosphatidylglycerol synthase domain-containing protein n=1 Tax=unclassified Mucilaginibacter TaxID=2617802 RepID=UPI0031F61244